MGTGGHSSQYTRVWGQEYTHNTYCTLEYVDRGKLLTIHQGVGTMGTFLTIHLCVGTGRDPPHNTPEWGARGILAQYSRTQYTSLLGHGNTPTIHQSVGTEKNYLKYTRVWRQGDTL